MFLYNFRRVSAASRPISRHIYSIVIHHGEEADASANHGEGSSHGVFVPEVLGQYRNQARVYYVHTGRWDKSNMRK